MDIWKIVRQNRLYYSALYRGISEIDAFNAGGFQGREIE